MNQTIVIKMQFVTRPYETMTVAVMTVTMEMVIYVMI